MKKAIYINKEKGGRIMRQAILTLGMLALLSTSAYAGNMTGNYQGMAYLAEQEIRTELQAKATEEAELVADAAATDEQSRKNDK